MNFRLISVTALVSICLAIPVFAQDTSLQSNNSHREISLGLGVPEAIDFHGHVGVALGTFPDYQGSKDMSIVGMALADVRQDDFLFIQGASVNPNDGYGSVGWSALNFKYGENGAEKFTLSLGPVIRFHRGRDEDDNTALNGIGDIDDSAGSGVFLEANLGNWSADISSISQDVGEAGDGIFVAFRSGYTIKLDDRTSITPGVFTTWGDDDYMQGFFAVNSSQALQTGLPEFEAESGIKDVGLQITTTYSLSKKLLISGQIGYQRLLGDAADSPVLGSSNNGSDNQFRALFGFSFQF